ncbi:uncharacterized protein LOC111132889 [Crassostrea virginica]
MPQTMNKQVLLQSKLLPCGKDSARYSTWNLDKVTRGRAIKLNEQQVQRQQNLCRVLDRQKYYHLSKAHRAMEELIERGMELEKEGRIRQMLVERNLANTEENRESMDKLLCREKNMSTSRSISKSFPPENRNDCIWNRDSRVSDNSVQRNKILKAETQKHLSTTEQPVQRPPEKSQKLYEQTHIYEVPSETGATQRWHLPVRSIFSQFVANLRSPHYAKKITKDMFNNKL